MADVVGERLVGQPVDARRRGHGGLLVVGPEELPQRGQVFWGTSEQRPSSSAQLRVGGQPGGAVAVRVHRRLDEDDPVVEAGGSDGSVHGQERTRRQRAGLLAEREEGRQYDNPAAICGERGGLATLIHKRDIRDRAVLDNAQRRRWRSGNRTTAPAGGNARR